MYDAGMTESLSYSPAMSRWVEQANRLGLVSELSDKTNPSGLMVAQLTLTRPQVSPVENMLDVVHNADMILVTATRWPGGRWSHGVTRFSYAKTTGAKLPQKLVRYFLEEWAR